MRLRALCATDISVSTVKLYLIERNIDFDFVTGRCMSAAPKLHPIPLSVSALTTQLREVIEGCFPSIWVTGEISNFTRASSGHWYFTLKDAGAQLRAVMFRGGNLRMRFDPRDGLDVFARGRLTVYNPRGDYQFLIEEMQPKGIGAAELALRQLKERLAARGYFHPQRKRSLPRFPQRVGLIVSASGAAVRDMVELFAQRWPSTELIIRSSRVQGDGAAVDLAAAVRALNHLHVTGAMLFDAIVLGRGGGRSEDLWAFNDERVATCHLRVPRAGGVGGRARGRCHRRGPGGRSSGGDAVGGGRRAHA